jgi:hypothetical protein
MITNIQIRPFDALIPASKVVQKVVMPYNICLLENAKAYTKNNFCSIAHVLFPATNYPFEMEITDEALYYKAKENLQLQSDNGVFNKTSPHYFLYTIIQNAIPAQFLFLSVNGLIISKNVPTDGDVFTSHFIKIVKQQCHIPVFLPAIKPEVNLINDQNVISFLIDGELHTIATVDIANPQLIIEAIEKLTLNDLVSNKNQWLAMANSPEIIVAIGLNETTAMPCLGAILAASSTLQSN